MSILTVARRRANPGGGGGSAQPSSLSTRLLSPTDHFTGRYAATAAGTSRRKLPLPYGAAAGWALTYMADAALAAGTTLLVRIEGGETITWGGATSATLVAGQTVVSDPIQAEVPVGGSVTLRETTTGTDRATAGRWTVNDGVEGWSFTDLYTGTGTAGLTTTGGPGLHPYLVVGQPLIDKPALLICGDSIIAGSTSFAEQAARTAGVPSMNFGTGGEGSANGFRSRLPERLRYIGGASRVQAALHQIAINNVGMDWRYSTQQLVLDWTLYRDNKLPPIQLTCTPWTTSTDEWTTTSGQSTVAQSATIQALNGWLREGAPIANGAPVTSGDTGYATALRLGDAAHPAWKIWDTGAAIQSPDNPSLAKVGAYSSTDGVHPSAQGHLWLAADLAPRLSALIA